MTEREKMLAGQLYNAEDPELSRIRLQSRKLIHDFNVSQAHDQDERQTLLQKILGYTPDNLFIEPPFRCDYGCHIHFGKNVFLNFNCVFLDVADIYIGDDVLIGPGVQLYTATHPMDFKTRSTGLELGYPIKISSGCWIGGNVTINPGVSIGERTVIGSGSVVTRDIPDNVFAAGNPCRVIRTL